MNMKRGLMILSLGAAVALGGFGSGQAFFNSPLAANSHYRPINFGMGYEMYVDLSSLETVKDDGQGWIFKVNLFRSPEDSGNIEGTYTLTYKVSHGQAWLYNDSTLCARRKSSTIRLPISSPSISVTSRRRANI